MQPEKFDIEDYRWLISDAATSWLIRVADDSRQTLAIAQALRKDLTAERTHLVIEQVDLRRRAAAKFPDAERMFFTRKGFEQATDLWLARYKARMFPSQTPVADLCCGIGGDLLALAERGPVVAVDRDPVSAFLSGSNLAVLGLTSSARVVAGDIETVSLADCDAWHIDPDRRPGGRRVVDLKFIEPSLAVITALLEKNPHSAIKLAPATVVSPEAFSGARLEWISRAGECKQLVATVGVPALAGPGTQPNRLNAELQRVATLLDSSGGVLRQVWGDEASEPPIAAQIGCYVFEPDSAVLAAKLQGQLAAEHQLLAIAHGIAYLTKDSFVADAALDAFEVLEVLPFRTRRIKSLLRERNIGRLEVKKRGVEVDPAQLQRELRGEGEESATLLITRVGKAVTAILARRVSEPMPR